MNIGYQKGTLKSSRTDALMFFAAEVSAGLNASLAPLRKVFGNRLSRILALEDFTGKAGSLCSFLTDGKLSAPRIFLAGVGPQDDLTPEKLRRAASLAASAAQKRKLGTVTFFLPEKFPGTDAAMTPSLTARSLAEGAILGTYRFRKYFTEDPKKHPALSRIRVTSEHDAHAAPIRTALRNAAIVCEGVKLARDLKTPPRTTSIRGAAETPAHQAQACEVTVWDENGSGGPGSVASPSAPEASDRRGS